MAMSCKGAHCPKEIILMGICNNIVAQDHRSVKRNTRPMHRLQAVTDLLRVHDPVLTPGFALHVYCFRHQKQDKVLLS